MEAKLSNCTLSGGIFNCSSRFPQAVQIAMLISYRKVIVFTLLLRSSNLCASIFLLNSESINNAAFPSSQHMEEQNFLEVCGHIHEQGLLQQGSAQGRREFTSALWALGRVAPFTLR